MGFPENDSKNYEDLKNYDNLIKNTVSDWNVVPDNYLTKIRGLQSVHPRKYYILFKLGIGTLNKREELFNYCKHKKRLLLDKTWFSF